MLKDWICDVLDEDVFRGRRALEMTELAKTLGRVLNDINEMPRPSRGGRSAKECDAQKRPCYDAALRDRLAAQARRRLEDIDIEPCSARRRRQRERDAILVTLADDGWIKLTGGGKARPWSKWEEVS